MMNDFKTDVENGLNSDPKRLPSKYFYNEIGDELFVRIMNLPEYYLTRAEFEIFSEQTPDLVQSLNLDKTIPFELVELGAGDGTKTKELLKFLVKEGYQFDYLPVDISPYALENLKDSLVEEIPNLSVKTMQGDYFDVLKKLRETIKPRVALFLGSNLGNMSDELARTFLETMGHHLNEDDKLILGLDQIKSPEIVIPAYNDASGVTAKFNLNLLRRINEELGGNFDLNKFRHVVHYTEKEGILKSFLESTEDQQVRIDALDKVFAFRKSERIHTEISRKYNDELLEQFLLETPLSITDKLTDSNGYFADYILKKD